MTILGSLVLHSDRPVPEFELPELKGLHKREGHHVGSRHNGSFREYFDLEPLELLVPQRYKRMTVLASDNVKHELSAELSTLDSQFEGARQLFKLQKLLDRFQGQWFSVVNVSNFGADGTAQSGGFYLLSSDHPLHIALVFDSNSGSVQLVWATFDFKRSLREQQGFNYSFFLLPTERRMPLFVPSQALCSKWWRLTQSFDGQRYGLLKACNAIEMILYKNPHAAKL